MFRCTCEFHRWFLVLWQFFFFFGHCKKLQVAVSLEGLFFVSRSLACLPVLTIIPVGHFIFIVAATWVIAATNWYTLIYAWASRANLNDTIASVRLWVFENILLSVLMFCLLIVLRDCCFIVLDLCSVFVFTVHLGRLNLSNHCVGWGSSPWPHSLILPLQISCLFSCGLSAE